MRLTNLPIKYLESFLYKGINRANYCIPLLAHFDAKLNSWSSKLLSTTGRITLIRHVLGSMPLYIIASSRIPKSVMDAFVEWLPSLAVLESYLPTHRGRGIGYSKLLMVQQAYDCLLWWKYHQSDSLWSAFCRWSTWHGVCTHL